MKHSPWVCLTLLIMSSFVFAAPSSPSPIAKNIVHNAKKECAQFENGQFETTKHAITRHDLTGDGHPEEIIDAGQFACSTSVSMWGGSGGTMLWVIVNGKAYEFLANRWKIVDFDNQQILLLAVHPSECSDSIGPCYRALVWSDGFRTTQ